jgi:hypothetical protein
MCQPDFYAMPDLRAGVYLLLINVFDAFCVGIIKPHERKYLCVLITLWECRVLSAGI